MKNKFEAYDYDSQSWVFGNEAKMILRGRILEELTLLRGEKGLEFFNFISKPGEKRSLQDLIVYNEHILETLR